MFLSNKKPDRALAFRSGGIDFDLISGGRPSLGAMIDANSEWMVFMHTQRIEFSCQHNKMSEVHEDLHIGYLSALRMNGQICGNEWNTFYENDSLIAIVRTPEPVSLSHQFDGKYVTKAIEDAEKEGVMIRSSLLSGSLDNADVCQCDHPQGYILYTHFISLSSPVRCLDCFGQTPLYRLPCMPSEEFYELICWQSDYQSCDHLQMNCTVLEKPAINQLSKPDSSLSKMGLENCRILSELTGKPFYYYLYRGHNGRSLAAEKKRLCPVCKSPWLLDVPLHSLFKFRCDHCFLLSNFALNL